MKVLDKNYSSFLAREAKKGELTEMKKFLQINDGGKKERQWNFGKK